MDVFYVPFVHAEKKPGVEATPLWNTLPLFNQLAFEFGKCGSWKQVRSCARWPRISQRWPIGNVAGPGTPVKGV